VKTPSILALTFSALALASLSGCIIVATDRTYHSASKKDLASVRQIDPTQGVPTIRSEYKEELSKLAPGMSVASFREIFPNALFVEQQADAAPVDAYSVKLNIPYRFRDGSSIHTAQDEAWFYFRDGNFVKWGEPNQWP
jgi:hypothetical protein